MTTPQEALRLAGAKMANTMFNLAQNPGRVLTAADCAKFDVMRKDWDAATAMLQDFAVLPIEPDATMKLASKRYKASTKITTGPGFYRAMTAAYLKAAPNREGKS